MTTQPDLFSQPTGTELRDKGISSALDHAELAHENWGDQAYAFLKKYARTHRQFMAEDVRQASEGIVPEPPSKRAWGGIIVRGKIAGIIERIGYGQVNNPKAHRANAAVWQSKICNPRKVD